MSRAGFTLVEVLVATVVTAIVVTLATAVVGSTTDLGRRVERRAIAHQETMADLAWLRQIAAGVTLGPDGGFEGSPTSATFRSAVWSPEGWLTERRIRFLAGEATGLGVDVEGVVSLSLFTDRRVRLQYLIVGTEGRHWVRGWESRSNPPLALRIHRGGAPDREPETLTLLMAGGT